MDPAGLLRSIWFENEKTAAARRGTKIPILAKLTPNVACMSPAAEAAKRGGADGIAAINTIKSIIKEALRSAEKGIPFITKKEPKNAEGIDCLRHQKRDSALRCLFRFR